MRFVGWDQRACEARPTNTADWWAGTRKLVPPYGLRTGRRITWQNVVGRIGNPSAISRRIANPSYNERDSTMIDVQNLAGCGLDDAALSLDRQPAGNRGPGGAAAAAIARRKSSLPGGGGLFRPAGHRAAADRRRRNQRPSAAANRTARRIRAGSGGEAAAATLAGGGKVFASWGGRAGSSPEPGPRVRPAAGRMAPIRARSRGDGPPLAVADRRTDHVSRDHARAAGGRTAAAPEPPPGRLADCGNLPPLGRRAGPLAPRGRGDLRPHRRADPGRRLSPADPLARGRPDRLGPAATGDGSAARIGPRAAVRQPGESRAADRRVAALLSSAGVDRLELGAAGAGALLRRVGGGPHAAAEGLRRNARRPVREIRRTSCADRRWQAAARPRPWRSGRWWPAFAAF